MTKKHFNAIAHSIRCIRQANDIHQATVDAIVEQLCDEFKAINPNFNRDKFIDACGMDRS